MMKFSLEGVLTGVKIADKASYITIKPSESVNWTRKGDRQAAFNLELSKTFDVRTLPPAGSPVVVQGEVARTYTDWEDPNTNRIKEIENHRFLAVSVALYNV